MIEIEFLIKEYYRYFGLYDSLPRFAAYLSYIKYYNLFKLNSIAAYLIYDLGANLFDFSDVNALIIH